MKKITLLLFLISLTGCVSYYESPINGETAFLRVQMADSGYGLIAGISKEKDFSKFKRLSDLGGPEGYRNHIENFPNTTVHDNNFKSEFKVSASTPIFISFQALEPVKISGSGLSVLGCDTVLELILEPNRYYELTFSWKKTNECSVNVYEVTFNSDQSFVKKQIERVNQFNLHDIL